MDNPFQNILMLQDSFTRRGLKWSPKNVQKGLDLLQQSEELYKAWEDASPTYVPIGDPPCKSLSKFISKMSSAGGPLQNIRLRD